MPFPGIGAQIDFQMRASIVPLAVLALLFADWAIRQSAARARAYVVAIMALASVTGVVEAANAVRLRPSPVPGCSLAGIWARQTGLIVDHASYFAATDALSLRARPQARAGENDPARCWDRPWKTPS